MLFKFYLFCIIKVSVLSFVTLEGLYDLKADSNRYLSYFEVQACTFSLFRLTLLTGTNLLFTIIEF